MPETIKSYRVLFLPAVLLFVAGMLNISVCRADDLKPAPVDNGFLSAPENGKNKTKPTRIHLHSDEYHGYDTYLVRDNSEFDCPVTNDSKQGRIAVKYHDDFPMHETFSYKNTKTPCNTLYYPYNYPVPR